VDLSPSCMRVGLTPLGPRFDHVDPYKLMHGHQYVFDTYTNFVRSNARAQLPSNMITEVQLLLMCKQEDKMLSSNITVCICLE